MSREIEEMADILCEAKEHDCKGGNDCLCVKQAEALYNAGYRKQSEGECLFEPSCDCLEGTDATLDFKCSLCGSREVEYFHYCPNCGAKMRKEDEGK
jgi:hypothetical protein